MKNKIITCGVGCLCCLIFTARGQSTGPQTLNASGGSTAIAGKTYEYSIGEMTLVHTATGANIIVTQGVLQPSEQQPSGIHDNNLLAGSFSVYPNPGRDIIFLQPSFEKGGELTFQLYDALGRVLKTDAFQLKTGNEKQSISLSSLASGTYTLDVSFNQQGTVYKMAYKVQKIH